MVVAFTSCLSFLERITTHLLFTLLSAVCTRSNYIISVSDTWNLLPSYQGVQEALVALWFICALAIAVVLGLIHTVTAGKGLTSEFMLFHTIGMALSKLLL